MNAVSMNKTSKKMQINDFFEAAKLVSLLSLIASIEMYIMGIFTTVTLPAVLLFAFLTFLAVQHAKKEKISGVFTSTLIVANCVYFATIAFLFGRMFVR